MKRCLTLGISLCLVGLLSGCCCGRGLGRCGGGCSTGYAPACSPCGQSSFGGFAPLGGGCNSCGQGGAPVYGAPGYGGVPTGYIQSEGFSTAATGNGAIQGNVYPQAAAANYGQPAYGQPAQFSEVQAPVTAALMKPESLATY